MQEVLNWRKGKAGQPHTGTLGKMRTKDKFDGQRMLLILLALVIAFSVAMTEISNAALTAGKSGKTTWVYMGAGKDGKAYKSTNTGNKQPKYTVKVGSKNYVGYCINHGKGWGTGTKMTSREFSKSKTVAGYSAAKQELLSYVLLYGYNTGKSAPYGNANDYYAATQTLIWQVLDGDVVMNSSGTWTKNNTSDKAYKLIKGHSYGVKCYDYIKKQMSAHVKGTSFAKKTSSAAKSSRNTMKYNYKKKTWSITLTDKNALNYYKKTAITSGLKMTRSGHKYTFTASKSGKYSVTLMADKSYGTSQSAMVFDSSNSGIQSVALGATDSKAFYAAFETEGTGTGRIVKKDTDGNQLAGFQFKVVCASNGYNKTLKTGSDGTIAEKLYPGNYTVTEVLTKEQIKDGWQKAKAVSITIKEGKTSSIEIINERDRSSSLKICKITSDDGPVSGFVFRVRGIMDNSLQLSAEDIIKNAALVYNDDDYIVGDWELADGASEIIRDINDDAREGKTGAYIVRLKAKAELKNHGESEDEKEVAKTEPQKTQSAAAKKETENITKDNEQMKAESAKATAESKIQADEEGSQPQSGKSDDSDKKQENNDSESENNKNVEKEPDKNLKGTIEKETKASAKKDEELTLKTLGLGEDGTEDDENPGQGSKPSEEPKAETIELSIGVTVSIEHVGAGGNDKVKKTEGNVTLYDLQWAGAADVFDREFTTDSSGVIVINDVEPGTYTVSEVMNDSQKARYRKPESQTIVVKEGDEEIEPFVFENIAKESKVKVIKTCADGEIENITFRITGTTAWGDKLMSVDEDSGEEVEGITVSTDENGIADFGYLPAGKYLAEEIGIDLDSYFEISPQNFEITGEEEDGSEIALTFENKRRCELSISKQDATTGEELEGATLRLTDKESGQIVDEWLSEKEPHIITGLEYGKVVILQELLPPVMVTDEQRGFLNSEGEYVTGFATADGIEITVGSEDKAVMVDELTQVVVSKQDETTSEELEGASLEIIDPETGDIIHSWISEKEPHMIEGLIEGKTYVLREDQAPLGFDIAEEISFTVGEDNDIVMYDNHTLTQEEKDKKHSPDTGDRTNWKLILALAILMLISVTGVTVLAVTRNEEKRL